MRKAIDIQLSPEEKKQLTSFTKSRSVSVRLAERSQIILYAASGMENIDIAEKMDITRQKAARWRDRYAKDGLNGISKDAPRSGRFPKVSLAVEKRIIELTTTQKPKNATHWSRSTMAKEVGVSDSTVGRIWKNNGLKPHLHKTFKVSKDSRFAEKTEDIIGLYMSPPENAIVFSCDEKSQIQALDRTQPGLPLKKGRAGTYTHDYKRNGTTTLFAALNVLSGEIFGTCMKKHRHQEWIKFLNRLKKTVPSDKEVHIICDNYATHKHEKVKNWEKRNRRFHFHFTPTSSSWLNMVERFFRDITQNRIRRGVFHSEGELIAAIDEYINIHNKEPKPFIWTATAKDILEKVKRARGSLDKLHTA